MPARQTNRSPVYQAERKYLQAEPLYVKALEGRLHILGPDHPDTLRTLNNLAALYVDEAKCTRRRRGRGKLS